MESLRSFLARYKGDVVLALALGVYLLSFWFPGSSEWLRSAGEAALVGALCDLVAIKMLFDRIPLLPGSGIIPRQRQAIIEAISAAVEERLLTPAVIRERLREIDMPGELARVCRWLQGEEALLRQAVGYGGEGLARYVDSEEFFALVHGLLKDLGGLPLEVAHTVGVVDTEEMAAKIALRLRDECRREAFRERVCLLVRKTLEEQAGVFASDEDVRQKIRRWQEEAISRWILPGLRGQIRSMVRENLLRLPEEEVKRLIEEHSRPHLQWIRVNGGVLGGVLGAVFFFVKLGLG